MKNKKLLSLLCLVALVGCGTKTSTSSTNNQPSSPASSSTVAPSSPVSSTTEESSSTASSSSSSSSSSTTVDSSSSSSTTVDSSSSSSTTVDSSSTNVDTTPIIPSVQSKFDTLKEKVANGITGTLKSAEYVQSSLGSSSRTNVITNFYTNVSTQEKIGGYSGGTVFKTVKDGRYYEVETSEYGNSTVTGYKVVDEVVNENEITSEEVENNLSNYGTSMSSDTFGAANSIDGIVNGIFNTFDAENCYDIRFQSSYNKFDSEEAEVSSLSYVKLSYNPALDDTKVYKYSAEFNFNSNDELGSLKMVQSKYSPAALDTDNGCLEAGYLPESTTVYEYAFEYGDLEENTDFNISDYIYSDYTVKFYETLSETYNPSTYEWEYTYEDEVTDFSKEFETGTTLYVVVSGTPETVTTDKPILKDISVEDGIDAYPGDSVTEFTFEKAGEITLTFESAAGITKEYTFKTYAPDPLFIEADGDIPASISVNQEIELPTCYVEPENAEQDYTWSIVSGNEYAEISFDEASHSQWYSAYTLKGIAAGEVVLRATSIVDETVYTDYEIEVLDPLSEEELSAIILDSNWGYNNYGQIYSLDFKDDGTAVANFGKEYYPDENGNRVLPSVDATYTFDWVLDYSNSSLTVSNGEWHDLVPNSQFSTWKLNSTTVDSVGRFIELTFSFVNYGSTYEESFSFVQALSDDELHSKIESNVYDGYASFGYDTIAFTIEFFEDGTGRFYYTEYVYDPSYQEVKKELATFSYEWNADNNIVISNLSNETMTVNQYGSTYTFSVGNTITPDKYFGNIVNIDVIWNDKTSSGVFNIVQY